MFRTFATVAGASLLLVGMSAAQAQAWERLGSRTVSDKMENDSVSGVGEGRFSQIRLCVARRAVHFRDVDVVFGNGGKQDVKVRKRIGPGACTRAIDLKGNKRRVRRVVMRYETIRNKGPQAVVTVFAR